MSSFFRYFYKRSAARQALTCIVVGCASACVSAAQSTAATFQFPAAPQPSISLAQAPGTPPASAAANAQPGRLDMSLRQALQMALKNNLDIELEQVDQTIADVGVSLARGGGLPRPINYTVADAPAGEGPVAVPLLSFSSPGLSPLSVDPITSTISSSYNTSRVLGGSHSLLLTPAPYSSGSPVPGFDAQLLGRYGWLRRNPSVSLLTLPPGSVTPADTVITDNTLSDTLLT